MIIQDKFASNTDVQRCGSTFRIFPLCSHPIAGRFDAVDIWRSKIASICVDRFGVSNLNLTAGSIRKPAPNALLGLIWTEYKSMRNWQQCLASRWKRGDEVKSPWEELQFLGSIIK